MHARGRERKCAVREDAVWWLNKRLKELNFLHQTACWAKGFGGEPTVGSLRLPISKRRSIIRVPSSSSTGCW